MVDFFCFVLKLICFLNKIFTIFVSVIIKDLFNMTKDTLSNLQDISDRLEDIHRDLIAEEKVMAAELADRKHQGLTGDAAVKHYNEWMDRHGMSHLKVPYLS